MHPERWFRRLLRLFPGDFRGDFADDMTATFRDQHRDAARGGRMALMRLWRETMIGIVTTAPREHADLLTQDVGYGLRVLRRAPAFALAAILTLALGIGANTAIFTLVDAVLLRPLPFAAVDRLLWIRGSFSGGDGARVSPPDFRDYRGRTRSFAGMAAMFPQPYTINGGPEPERVQGALVTTDFFEVLGARPVAGRTFTPSDAAEVDRATTVIIGYGLWQRRFGGREDAIGQPLIVNGRAVIIVGIMPAAVALPRRSEVWLPCTMSGADMEVRAAHFLIPIARLKTDVTQVQAQHDADAVASALEREYPKSNTTWKLRLEPLRDVLVQDTRESLVLLSAAVGLVLLIACVNVANLLLARAAARSHEIAVRLALGAGRGRIARQLLTESLLLASAGGIAGLVVARVSLGAFAAIAPPELAGVAQTTIDLRVLLFTGVLSIATGVLFGLLPALRATEIAQGSLRSADRGGSRLGRATGRALVCAELALATTLLIGAGLLMRSLATLGRVDPGFDPRGLLTFEIAAPTALEVPVVSQFYAAFVDALTALPGVEHAALASTVPLSSQGSSTFFEVSGRRPADPNDRPGVYDRRVTAGYFAAMRLPILRGRGFTPEEARAERAVVAISQGMAERYFDGDPIGQHVLVERFPGQRSYEVVAIVGDIHFDSLHMRPFPEMYMPSVAFWTTNVVIRSSLPPAALMPAVRSALARLDPSIPISKIASFDERVAASMAAERFRTLLLTCFSVIALGLAAVGVYGLAAYSVAQRTREIGVRLALGAAPSTILRAELVSAARLTAAGVGAGLVLALALLRALRGLLFGVSTSDPATLAVSTLLLGVVMLAASYGAARRATRVDPIVALRTE